MTTCKTRAERVTTPIAAGFEMQAAYIKAALQRAAHAPAMAGISIKSVSVAATRDSQHDPVMTIVWSMPDSGAAIDAPRLSMPGVSCSMISRPADTAVLIDRDGDSPAEIEDALMAVAWELGAWDMCRDERPPLPDGATWRESRYGVGADFGVNDSIIMGHKLVAGARAPDVVCSIAASDGYVVWRFIPLAMATPTARRLWGHKDSTLQPDCTRAGKPGNHRGAWFNPQTPGMANEHQYQLGRKPK